jgi:Domain of unknown function (DUF1707)
MMRGMSPGGSADDPTADPTAPGERTPAGDLEPREAPGDLGQLRASHQDRDRVVEVLRVAAGDGRLTADELDERLEAAMTARTYGELAVLTTDLPTAGDTGPGLAVPEPKDVVRIDCGSGRTKRDGRWVVPRRMEVRVSSGSVVLDFTDAVVTQPALQLDAEVRSGHLKLVTKPGLVVDADDVAVRSGHVKVREPWGPGVPATLRIQVSGKVGSGALVARPPRRTFWQWLTRRPVTWAAAHP